MAFTKAQGAQLALFIRQWLTNSNQGDPQGELLNFVTDLENANNVGVWAGVNYERILPFKEVMSKGLRRWLVVRNTFIFLPIVITWLAMEQATGSWAKSGDENFLQHWHSSEAVWSLKYVAWIDAAIIASIVVITFIAGLREENSKHKLALERQYQGLIIALERDLSGYRYLSLQDINNAAADTLTSLQLSTQEVENAAQSFAGSAKEAHDAIVGANDVVHRTFAPAVQRLDDTILALQQAGIVHKDMVDVVKTVQADFATQMGTLRQGVIDVLSAIDTRMNHLMQNVDGQISGAASALSTAAQSAMGDISRAAQTAATSSSQQIGQQMQSIASSFDQALRELSALAGSLDKTVSALNSTSNNVMVNTATLADDLNQIHDALQLTISRLPR
jgi:hypothetical protein